MKAKPDAPKVIPTITRCVLCGREKGVHPQGCKPIWAKEREETTYATSRLLREK